MTKKAFSIVVICSANVCRSPMAHAIFAAEVERRGLPVTVHSGGTWWELEGHAVADEALRTCERHGTPLRKFSATHYAAADLEGAARVFVMERRHMEVLLGETSLASERLSVLGVFDPEYRGAEIDDPMGQDAAAFDACYGRLRDCIRHYLDTTNDFS